MTRRSRLACALALALALAPMAACSGEIDPPSFSQPGSPSAVSGAGHAAPGSSSGDRGTGQSDDPIGRDPSLDVNRVGIHRLNNSEYDYTVRDLLGVPETPARAFIADEKADGFDNIAAALGMTETQYEQYFDAGEAVVEQAFADPALRARILTCTPATAANEDACLRKIIAELGARAWRRPLLDDEVDRLASLAAEARALGEDFTGSAKQVAQALLVSVPFLYRTELDPDPSSIAPHRLDSYALASRLSYLVWSSMPDDRLFELAASSELLDDGVLASELERMLADARAERFIASFAGQWLGVRELGGHRVDTSVFARWSEPLRDAMIREGQAFFAEFLRGERGMDEFFTAQLEVADAELAELYGGAPQSSDERRGFLGLSSFLTVTSFAQRTAPTLRGKWVLENLLCQEIAPPPPNVPQLDDAEADADAVQSQNVRTRLEEHRKNPQCASCHQILDPIGLGLEHFDAIGAYRESYPNGDAIDASGTLPDGSTFDGLGELSEILASDERLLDCASEKLLTYALSRAVVDTDEPYLQRIRSGWRREGLGLSALLRQIVLSDPFRFRRGESEP